MTRARDHGIGEGVSIHIRPGQGDGKIRIFDAIDGLRVRDRRIVHRPDGKRDRRVARRVNRPIIHLESETIRAVVIRRRDIG